MTPRRIDVGPLVGVFRVHRLLRGHVVDRAHDLAGAGQLVLLRAGRFEPGQTHVQNLDRPLPIQQQVRRLDVAMHHAVLVGVWQSAGRLQDAVHGLVERQRPLLLDERREVGAVDVLHHQEVRAAGFVGVVGGDDVGMFELGGGFDLALEPPQRLGRSW